MAEQAGELVKFWDKYGQYIMGVGSTVGTLVGAYWWLTTDLLVEEEEVKPKIGLASLESMFPYNDTTGTEDLRHSELLDKVTLEDITWKDKRVLLRTDYNVPIDVRSGVILDTTRIDHSISTIRYLLQHQAKCITVISHLGRPLGAFNKQDFSLFPVVDYLKQCLGKHVNVEFLPDVIGDDIVLKTYSCKPGTVYVAENLRFHKEELGMTIDETGKEVVIGSDNIDVFTNNLQRLADAYILDCFAVLHRQNASITMKNIPVRVAGSCLSRELYMYSKFLLKSSQSTTSNLEAPTSPYVAVIGNAMKLKDRARVLLNLLNYVDHLYITGGMAFTFKTVMQKNNMDIHTAFIDVAAISDVEKILRVAREKHVEIHLPEDHMFAPSLAPDAPISCCDDHTKPPEGWVPLDIGPRSRAKLQALIGTANTVLFNGIVGCWEIPALSGGTVSLLTSLVDCVKRGGEVLVSGGDASAAARYFYIGEKPAADQLTHVSTGGGSSLVLLEGKMLHGVATLSNRADVQAELKSEK